MSAERDGGGGAVLRGGTGDPERMTTAQEARSWRRRCCDFVERERRLFARIIGAERTGGDEPTKRRP